MKKIQFEYQKGWGDQNRLKEIVEFDDDVTEEEIEKEFQDWVWDKVGDYVCWEEVE